MATPPDSGAAVEQGAATLLREVYEALASGDRRSLLACLQEDFEWVERDRSGNPLAGSHRGRIGIQRLLDQVPPEWRDLSLEPRDLVAEGDRVVVLGAVRGELLGEPVEVPFAHVWEVRDDLLARGESYTGTSAVATSARQAELARLASELAESARRLRAGWAELEDERDSKPVEPAEVEHGEEERDPAHTPTFEFQAVTVKPTAPDPAPEEPPAPPRRGLLRRKRRG